MEGNSYDEEEKAVRSQFFQNAAKVLRYDVAAKWPNMSELQKTMIRNKVRNELFIEEIFGRSDLKELQMSTKPKMDRKRQTHGSLQGWGVRPETRSSSRPDPTISSHGQRLFVELYIKCIFQSSPGFGGQEIAPAEAVVRHASENVRPLFEDNVTMEEIESILKNDPPVTKMDSSKAATFSIVNGADITATMTNDGVSARAGQATKTSDPVGDIENLVDNGVKQTGKKQKQQLCTVCHKFFSNKCALRRHQESVHWHKKSSRCNYCATDQWFTPYARDDHVKKVHGKVTDRQRKRKPGDEISTESAAEITFSSNSPEGEENSAIKHPIGESKFQCEVSSSCHKQFTTLKGIKIHMKASHNRKETVRNTTSWFCRTSEGELLKIDFKNSRKHKRKDIRCLLCTESFSSNKAQEIHVRQFHDVDIFACSFCHQEFGTVRELDDHVCNEMVDQIVVAKIRLRDVIVKLDIIDSLIDNGTQTGIRNFAASKSTIDTASDEILCDKCGTFDVPSHRCPNTEGDLRDLGKSRKKAVQKNLCEICGEFFEASSGHGCQSGIIRSNEASPDSAGLTVFDLGIFKDKVLCEKCGLFVTRVLIRFHKCRIDGDTTEEDGKNAEKPLCQKGGNISGENNGLTVCKNGKPGRKRKEYFCPHCEPSTKNFSSSCSLKRHMKRFHPKKLCI